LILQKSNFHAIERLHSEYNWGLGDINIFLGFVVFLIFIISISLGLAAEINLGMVVAVIGFSILRFHVQSRMKAIADQAYILEQAKNDKNSDINFDGAEYHYFYKELERYSLQEIASESLNLNQFVEASKRPNCVVETLEGARNFLKHVFRNH